MDDRKWGDLSEGEFDALLGAGLQDLPPEEVVEEVTPWKRAMNRVLAGMALSTVTLNFWLLDTILPAIGVVLMLLGFRSLRFENRWFGSCFVLTLLRAVHLFLLLILNTTIWVSAGALWSRWNGPVCCFCWRSMCASGRGCGRCGKRRGSHRRPRPRDG